MNDKIFLIDLGCDDCSENLEKIKEIESKCRKDVYSATIKKTGKQIKTKVILIPDYNSHGILTRWHIDKVVK